MFFFYCSILILLGTVFSGVWVGWVRYRGSLGFWSRGLVRREFWSVGLELDQERTHEEELAALRDIAAFVRTLELESGRVVRQWDLARKKQFVGLVFEKKVARDRVEKPFEWRHYPSQRVLRVSGRPSKDGETARQAAERAAAAGRYGVDLEHPIKLSGTSFSLFEWEIEGGEEEQFSKEGFGERVFQMKDAVLLPVFGTLFAMGLVGTRNVVLIAIGIVLLILISGVGKFVFLINREDEAQEGHLQNY